MVYAFVHNTEMNPRRAVKRTEEKKKKKKKKKKQKKKSRKTHSNGNDALLRANQTMALDLRDRSMRPMQLQLLMC
jgi:hypothetical protein